MNVHILIVDPQLTPPELIYWEVSIFNLHELRIVYAKLICLQSLKFLKIWSQKFIKLMKMACLVSYEIHMLIKKNSIYANKKRICVLFLGV